MENLAVYGVVLGGLVVAQLSWLFGSECCHSFMTFSNYCIHNHHHHHYSHNIHDIKHHYLFLVHQHKIIWLTEGQSK